MNQVEKLIRDIALSRNRYLKLVNTLTEEQAKWKPSTEKWNTIELTEHLFWAEHGGLLGMWKTLYSVRAGEITPQNEAVHHGLSIEEVVERTWKSKEIVPAVAAPRMGGTLKFWAVSLKGLQNTLKSLGSELSDADLSILAHPHPISGVLDFRQRLEFLRFHIDRHDEQVQNLIEYV